MSNEREAAFVRWMTYEAKCVVGSTDPYPAGIERRNREVWNAAWQAARQSAGATGQEPVASMDDLSMLIRQLVHALRKAAPDNALAERAMDYLKRKGLQGSPLRAAPVGDNGAKRIVSWLRANANAENEPKARAAFIEAHNAALKICESCDGEGMIGSHACPDCPQPADSKRVELTDDELGHLRLIVAFCETLRSIERGSYADDALRALRLFLARASAKGE
jgi:hypothetical protein